MKGEPDRIEEQEAAKPNGADYLKFIWGISDTKRPREMPPPHVSSDIYVLPATDPPVPKRMKPRGP